MHATRINERPFMHHHYSSLAARFAASFWWNLSGSISFELFKIAHHSMLLSYASRDFYGFLGSTYAIIYGAVRLSDCGTTNSLSPYFHKLTKTKHSFKTIGLKFFGLPYLASIILGGICAWYLYTYSLPQSFSKAPGIIIFYLALSEATRALLRQFLHIAFKSKQVILVEQAAFISYLLFFWGSIYSGFLPLTSSAIFIPFLAESLICSTSFIWMSYRFYQTLPETSDTTVVHVNQYHLIKMRLFNWLLRVCRELFTSNILTPLFAVRFGLAQAGIFYFIAALAMSIYAVVKASIGYSGSALFTHTKHASMEEKQQAFRMLVARFFAVVLPCLIFLGINYPVLNAYLQQHEYISFITTSFITYLAITFLEFFSVLYEQLYFAEERSGSLFAIKTIECALITGFLFSGFLSNSIPGTLLTLLAVKAICLAMLLIHAYQAWGVTLLAKLPWPLIAASTLASSALCYALLQL